MSTHDPSNTDRLRQVPRQAPQAADRPQSLQAGEPADGGMAEVDLGPADTAWWEVPLPCCFDCRGDLRWCEAGYVPGTRRCRNCGALFNVINTADGRVRLQRETLYQPHPGRLVDPHDP